MESLTIVKGDTFNKHYVLTDPTTNQPFDVSNWSIRGEIRDYPGAVQSLYVWPPGDLILEEGLAKVVVPATVSSLWVWSLAYYAIEMYNSTTVKTIDRGRLYADFEIVV